MFFLLRVDASHVYVRAWVLGCFHSLIGTRTFRRALTTSVDSCAEIKECPFSGVTRSGRVWRKVPESGARSVGSGGRGAGRGDDVAHSSSGKDFPSCHARIVAVTSVKTLVTYHVTNEGLLIGPV